MAENPDGTGAYLPDFRCGKCLEHWHSEPHLVHAFASVGIEHGKSTGEMAADYFASFHARKHRPLDEEDDRG